MGIMSESLSVSWRMFLSPEESFERINTMNTSACFTPFIIGTSSSLILLGYYFANVNFGWLLEQMTIGMGASQQTLFRNMLDRYTLWGLSSAGIFVSVILFNTLFALYFNLVAKVVGFPVNFGKA